LFDGESPARDPESPDQRDLERAGHELLRRRPKRHDALERAEDRQHEAERDEEEQRERGDKKALRASFTMGIAVSPTTQSTFG
jgi:hypothetical protein